MSAWSTSSMKIAAPLGRDPPREAAPDRDPHALLDLLLDPFGGGRHERLAGLVEQQERGRVRAEGVRDPVEQLLQQDFVGHGPLYGENTRTM